MLLYKLKLNIIKVHLWLKVFLPYSTDWSLLHNTAHSRHTETDTTVDKYMAAVQESYLSAFEHLFTKITISPESPPIQRRSISPMAEAGVKIRNLVGNFKENARYRLSIRMKKESGHQERFRPFPFTNMPASKELPTYNDVLLGEIQRRYEEELDKPRSNSEPDAKVAFPPKDMLQYLDTHPEERQANLSPEEHMSAYVSALQSTQCLLRAGLSRIDGSTLTQKVQEVFDMQDEEQVNWFKHIEGHSDFHDNIECR